MSQSQRDRAMQGFRKGHFDILVATDIAARGIDVNNVSHVINYDVPNTPEAYTHRIGRTGRSETEGMAFTFVTSKDVGWLRATERKIGSRIQRLQADGFQPDFADQEPASKGQRRDKGGRPGTHRRSGSSANRGRSRGAGSNRGRRSKQ